MSVTANQRSRKMLACTAEATAYQKAFGQELRRRVVEALRRVGDAKSMPMLLGELVQQGITRNDQGERVSMMSVSGF